MTTFAPASGDTLKSTSLEAALVEAVARFKEFETTYIETNPNTVSRLSVTLDSDARQITVAGNALPVDRTINSGGDSVFQATDHVPFTGFLSLATTLPATSIGEAVFQLVTKIEAEEALQTTIPQRLNSTINNSAKTYSFSVTLDVTPTFSTSGALVYTVDEYLA